jgi:5-methylcytosine-specific restriction endonuclease McrA
MDESLQNLVWQRARGICEYCLLPSSCDPSCFQIDRIIAEKHRGRTVPENLALSCLRCNAHKGPNIAGIDPVSSRIVPLFHPRNDRWQEHFRWEGPILVGLTPAGRATIEVLDMNHPLRVAFRDTLIAEGVFPPPE